MSAKHSLKKAPTGAFLHLTLGFSSAGRIGLLANRNELWFVKTILDFDFKTHILRIKEKNYGSSYQCQKGQK